ncbi:hypothetical protein GCM10029964_109700 [Kibdelosporangium lantanae]
MLGHLALTEVWAGRYEDARTALDSAIGRASGMVPAVLWATDGLLKVLTGDLAGAQELIEREFHAEGPNIGFRKAIVYRQVLGAVALLRGDDAEAVSVLTTAVELARAEGILEPARRQRLDGDLGQALVNTGRLTEATDLASSLVAMGNRLSRPTLLGVGLRVRGLVEAAEGDTASALSTLEEAVAAHRQSQLPWSTAAPCSPRGRFSGAPRRRRTRTPSSKRPWSASPAWAPFPSPPSPRPSWPGSGPPGPLAR